jgi:hypothetical protein
MRMTASLLLAINLYSHSMISAASSISRVMVLSSRPVSSHGRVASHARRPGMLPQEPGIRANDIDGGRLAHQVVVTVLASD